MAVEQRMIPVAPQTRDRVREVKGDRTYDELLSEWVEKHPERND